MTKKNQPHPVPTLIVCGLCGEPWPDHLGISDKPDHTVCIALLRAKSQRAPWTWIQPYPRPWVTWTTTGTGTVAVDCSATHIYALEN